VADQEEQESEFIHRPFEIEIITDEQCPEFVEGVEGTGWEAEVQNDRFTEWYQVDEDGILEEEPASWMIYFGFVKPERVPGMYLINTRNITVINPIGPSLQIKQGIRDKDPFIPQKGLFR
jgi:hypothetical protein